MWKLRKKKQAISGETGQRREDAYEQEKREKNEKFMQSLREIFADAVAKPDVLDKILALETVKYRLGAPAVRWDLKEQFGEEVSQLEERVNEEQVRVIEENYDVLVQPAIYEALFSHFPKDSERKYYVTIGNKPLQLHNDFGEDLHLVFNDAFIRKSLKQAKEDPSVKVARPPFFRPK